MKKVAFYSLHKFEKAILEKANNGRYRLHFFEFRLSAETAPLSDGFEMVSLFVNDDASASVLDILYRQGTRFIVLRSAGYNSVDMKKAAELGIRVARVPAYSPYAVAEHAVALMMALNRRLIRANHRVMELNFSLDGLTGFDMHGKTAGIVGTGKIGCTVTRILYGFGCRLLAYDKFENAEIKEKYGVIYTDFPTLCSQSDIITLHIPLNDGTKYLINEKSLALMKPNIMLINTSRGLLVNTSDVIQALKDQHVGYFGMDVYEEEEGLFFEDHSEDILQDDNIARLMSFQNVLITSHQAFLTDTALTNIADTTVFNLDCFSKNEPCENEIMIK